MIGEGHTIRLSAEGGVASRDDGTTSVLDAAAVAAIRSLMAEARFEAAVVSVEAAVALDEARRVAPRLEVSTTSSAETVSGEKVPLARLARHLEPSLSEALERRRSDRQLQRLGLDDLATVLVHAARIRSWTNTDDGYQASSRSAPSAGGRHPLELKVAVCEVAGLETGAWHFDPAACELVRQRSIDGAIRQALDAVSAAAGGVDDAPATVFAVAHFRRTLSRYPAGATLVWRDAGVLLGYLHLVASAAGLGSCIVGTAGQLIFNRDELVGDAGALMIGRTRSVIAPAQSSSASRIHSRIP